MSSISPSYQVTFSSAVQASSSKGDSKPMSCSLPSGAAAINSLSTINGMGISKIEKRARPGVYSTTGFLGEDESFQGVLMEDLRTVEKMGTTHIEIAQLLQAVKDFNYEIYSKYGRYGNKGKNLIQDSKKGSFVFKEKKISFRLIFLSELDPSTHKDFKPYVSGELKEFDKMLQKIVQEQFNDVCKILIKKEEVEKTGEQLLILKEVDVTLLAGGQESIFSSKSYLEHSWNANFWITNVKTKERLRIAEGIIPYVRELGFYEGEGNGNPYRLNPAQVMAVFTGLSTEMLFSSQSKPKSDEEKASK